MNNHAEVEGIYPGMKKKDLVEAGVLDGGDRTKKMQKPATREVQLLRVLSKIQAEMNIHTGMVGRGFMPVRGGMMH